MAIATLDGFQFPEGVVWSDRHSFSPIQTKKTFALDGSLILENFTKLAGRTITLKTEKLGDGWCGIYNMQKLVSLMSLFDDPVDPERTLVIGGYNFQVRFDREAIGVEVEPLLVSDATEEWSEQVYAVTARFITMGL